MQSQYRSPFSIGKRKTVYIDAADPRVQGFKANITAARLGAELVIVDSRVNTLSQAGRLSNIRLSSTSQKDTSLNPKSENFTKPGSVENLAASWQVISGKDVLAITWDFDATLPENLYVTAFSLKFVKTSNSTEYYTKSEDLNTTGISQKYDMTPEKNGVIFGPITTAITSISVAAQDSFGNTGDYVTIPGPTYNSGLTAPTITVTSIQNGYTVDCTNIGDQPASLDLISIEEYVSNASTEPTGVTYTQVSIGPKTINPITIYTSTTAKRWVKARYTNSSGAYGPYSVASAVTPAPVVNVDNTPPNEVTAVSASWSGDNIVISYTLPVKSGSTFSINAASWSNVTNKITYTIDGTHNYVVGDIVNIYGASNTSYNISGVVTDTTTNTFAIGNITTNPNTFSGTATSIILNDPGIRFQVALTAPNSSVGYFYAFPSGTSLNQTYTITKADLFTQFGNHYSSYGGIFKSIDAVDNKTSGVSFLVPVRTCTLTGTVPTFTTTALVNGYSVSYTLTGSAIYAKVYQKYTSWSGVTPIDSFTGTYLSGGASGTNTVTLSSVIDNDGIAVITIPTGYRIIGTGIPANTYITSVSGNQITVNNNFTSQVSGSITGYAEVYSGTSPANISSTIYANTYLLVRFYDDFECASNFSSEQIVVPLQPVTVDITGPGDVSTVNSPTSGIDSSGTLGFNGYINLTWTAVTDTTLRGYRIRFTTDTTNPVYSYVDYPIDQSNPPTGTLSYKLTGLSVGATYKLAIATYDEYNNTSSNYVSFTDATISGTPAITDYITAGNFQFGQGVDPSNTTGITGTKRGLFFDSSNYWFLNASNSARLKVGGSTTNYLLWNGTKFTVDGDITARGGSFSGNIALTTSGASIYSGDVTTTPGSLTGDGFIFNKDGLLIRKGTNQVSLDTTNGAITANAGNIADWVISSSKIEKLDPGSSKYAGLSSTGTYKFWAGSTVAGGDTTQFAVNGNGKVWAQDIQISGGSLDIGPAAPNGFHVNSSGILTASSVSLTGEIKASSGKITGNFQVESPGVFYAGTLGGSRVAISSAGLSAFDAGGTTQTTSIVSNATSGAPTFTTDAAKIGGWYVNSTSIKNSSSPSTDGTFSINSSGNITIFNTGTPNWKVLFSAANAGTDEVLVGGTWNSSTSNWTVKNFILTANGTLTVRDANLIGGTLSITGGSETMKFGNSVNGALNGIYINANNYWYDTAAFKVGSSSRYIEWDPVTTTLSIVGNLSFGSSDYLNANGNYSFGSGIITGTSSSVVFELANGSNNITFNNMPSTDFNGWAGDPTVTIDDATKKLVKGRRFIYQSLYTGSGGPGTVTNFDNITKVGKYQTGDGQKDIKSGDIVFIQEA